MLHPRHDIQIGAADELLEEAMQKERPEERGNDVCAIADEMLGPSNEELASGSLRTGFMNKEGAVEMLEQLGKILQKILDEHQGVLSPANVEKFQECVRRIASRTQSATDARRRVDDMRAAIRKSAGAFKAYAA